MHNPPRLPSLNAHSTFLTPNYFALFFVGFLILERCLLVRSNPVEQVSRRMFCSFSQSGMVSPPCCLVQPLPLARIAAQRKLLWRSFRSSSVQNFSAHKLSRPLPKGRASRRTPEVCSVVKERSADGITHPSSSEASEDAEGMQASSQARAQQPLDSLTYFAELHIR